MGKVKIVAFSVSLDGFGAGTNQNIDNPLGTRGEEIFAWMFTTKTFHKIIGKDGGTEEIDNDITEKSFENVGACIMGRNMFGPVRGEWKDDDWKGWWGEDPPFHVPVFVLTHYAKEPIEMKGGTIFHFVTNGIEAALEEAKKVADGKDIRIGGGVSTIHQFLQAGHIDEIRLAFSPIFLGSGEHLFSGIDLPKLGFTEIQKIDGEKATHIILTKK
ncbi:MAG TPA: dihydrofolate reductase family protein [Puia sp.]|jgi:dihydrofolate reductase|nr:dihydrofolate reductase family protein [Puia sp.]